MKSTKAKRKTYYIDPCTEGGQSSGFYEQKLTRKEAEQLKKENPSYFITDSYQKMLYFVQD